MADTSEQIGQVVLDAAIDMFRAQKRMAESAIRQITFEQMRVQMDPGGNSVAVIMKHMAGNMKSRWSDLLTEDGEKEWRDRDSEFHDTFESKQELVSIWEDGWATLFTTLSSLKPEDLTKTITIRSEPDTVIGAIDRQLSHYGYHLGQIVSLCRQLAGQRWSVLTIPRGESQAYNELMRQSASDLPHD